MTAPLLACLKSSLLVLLLACIWTAANAETGPNLDRGKYLAEAVAICFECHSEREYRLPGWPIKRGMKASGRILYGGGTSHQLVAPNISTDKATGIGKWTDPEIIRAIRDGVSRDGRRLNSEMPYKYYESMSPVDLNSIVAYLRSIKPVNHRLPSNIGPEKGEATSPGMDRLHSFQWSERILKGEFLVKIGSCETCHTPRRDGKYIAGLEFGGGVAIQNKGWKSASSNITRDPSGISYYDSKTFVTVMRTGKLGARSINPIMPWNFYRHLTNEDLEAIYEYLRSVPPVKHEVDNQERPTFCKKCLNRHGLGERN
jgi:mono/diheme cytochrome c family protein